MISVIMPTYNRGYIIKKAIDSVLSQTYDEIELIIIDDLSNDNTEEIIKNINNEKIKYIKLERNLGACAARNVGIKLARGEYVAFIDSDDTWEPEKLKKQLYELTTTRCDIAYCKYKYYINGILRGENPNVEIPKLQSINDTYIDMLKSGKAITSTILVKKSCLDSELFDENIPRWQEYDLILRLAQKYKIIYINETLVSQYIQENSISNSSHSLLKAINMIYGKHSANIEKNRKIYTIWINEKAKATYFSGHHNRKLFIEAYKLTDNLIWIIRYCLCILGINKFLLYLRTVKKKLRLIYDKWYKDNEN